MTRRIPTVVLGYGLAGLIPFLGLPLLSLAMPGLAAKFADLNQLYGAIILSFLGGARWGQEVRRERPRIAVITLSMLPSITGWLLAARGVPVVAGLYGLAASLALVWLWDLQSRDLPVWYPRLRTILTAGAAAGLVAQAIVWGLPYGWPNA